MQDNENFTRLKDAGLIDATHEFSDDDRRAIESLTEEEVTVIIRAAQKLATGLESTPDRGTIRGIIL